MNDLPSGSLGGIVAGSFVLALGGSFIAFCMSNVGILAIDQIFGGGGGAPDPTFVDLTSPIPGSDVLPTLSGGTFQTTDHQTPIAATAAFQPDTVNTVIYARFEVPAGIEVGQMKPLAGVKVELMDQDAPRPAGDTTAVIVPKTVVHVHGEIVDSTRYSYVKPTADEKLAEGTTDLDGIVRFALLKDQLWTTCGSIKSVTTHIDTNPEKNKTTVGYQKVPEANPDLYFRITMPDGSVRDTRQMPGGFMLDFKSSRVGTLANPLTFTFGPAVRGMGGA